ncbi:MAG: DNA mismatch repair protein MutS [Gemmatimonadota bacterium]
MKQWREAKSRHSDALIFFRVGDFYEMFYDDAEEGARLLDLTLTTRNNGGAADVPMAGVPVRARDEYIQELVRRGRRVAICEQVEDAAEAKGIVRREVIETVTPGAVLTDRLLSDRKNNFLVVLVGRAGPGAGSGGSESARGGGPASRGEPADTVGYALAAADVSTGELIASPVEVGALETELARLEPAELLLPRTREGWTPPGVEGVPVTLRPDWLFDAEIAADELKRRYRVHTLDGFGFQEGDEPLIRALGALVAYLAEVQPAAVEHLRAPRIERPGQAMALDEMTRRNLELIEPLRPDLAARASARAGTLLEVVDETATAMGARLLRRWLLRPLVAPERIWRRQDAVEELVENAPMRRALREELDRIRDLERLAAKVAAGRISPRELRALGDSLERLPSLRDALAAAGRELLVERRDGLDPLEDVRTLIARALVDEPPATLGDGGVIREGYDDELDELRETKTGAQDFIASLQARERERTGIGSLKVGFNKVFGYYLEVTKANLDRVPDDYQRKQTLANAERYFTPELKEWEATVLGAEEKITELEARLFAEVRDKVGGEVARIQAVAERVAELDVVAGLARLAERRRYVRPEVHTGYALEVRAGRHPVVETMMPREEFIPNDVVLDEGDAGRIMILTGPNMAGKSTLLRQVGLVQLLAQIGSFVPADAARLPVCDRIFTRVGASDNLVRGQSTFMVEMNETAAILHGATRRSLVLLDEIGRGTATYDGVSIAWAVTEHLHETIGAKTIFATHYHELTQLGDLLPGVVNANVAVKEVGDEIVFLRRLEAGGADRSYGIQVGRLAGLPVPVVDRARRVLRELEGAHRMERGVESPPLGGEGGEGGDAAAAGGDDADGENRVGAGDVGRAAYDQLSLFSPGEHPVVDRLRGLDVNGLTPLDALNLLAELRAEARGDAPNEEDEGGDA